MFDVFLRLFCALVAAGGLVGLFFALKKEDSKWHAIGFAVISLAGLYGLVNGWIPLLNGVFGK